jgi:asparagine synthase (glutamine-hydrolysing)
MCGICGIIDKRGGMVAEGQLRQMNALAAHRGPDGDGFRIVPGVALAHRRLAILDLNPRGAQPMCWRGRWWIVYNGEVYNYKEIRSELEALGHEFLTTTDTEVILAAYAEWGEGCLRRFNGMWAFAIHDTQEQTVFFARDRFGVKPLYFVDTQDRFAFASEIKQLLPLLPSVRANQAILLEWVLTSFENHRPETMFDGVSSLPGGHWMRISLAGGTRTTGRFYQLRVDDSWTGLGMDETAKRFADLFTSAVRLRLRSDVRVGTCLSGGLDSSASSVIASRMYRQETGCRFLGVHARGSEAHIDESGYANRIAAFADIELATVLPTTDDFLNTLDEVVYTQEEPFATPSMFMGWHVFREARRLGCPVMLNGQGGDEVLLGYERYFAAFSRSRSPLGWLREAFRLAQNSRLTFADVLRYQVYFTRPKARVRRLVGRSFLLPEYADRASIEFVYRNADAFRSVADLQLYEIEHSLPHLLRYEDRNSMRHSIETRLPFLDYRVVEAGLSMRPEYKIHEGWTKYALRVAMEGVLPDEIVWRRNKIGFEAPDRTWLGAARGRMLEEIAGSRIIGRITDQRRLLRELPGRAFSQQWMYFNLALWERVYGVAWD